MASSNTGGAGGAKDERRRRIAERGSDRMALITGRINALPPQPPSATSSPTLRQHPRNTQSLIFDQLLDHGDDQPRHLRPQSLSPAFFSEFHEDKTTEDKQDVSIASSRLRHQGGFRYSNLDDFDTNNEVEPLKRDSDTISEVPEDNNIKTKPPPRAQTGVASLDTKKPKKAGRVKPAPFFSSRELNSCIIASETMRALSSLIIAFVVVLFYMISERITLASRPLYIVLLTDVTIVLGRLYQEKARLLEEADGAEEHGEGHRSWGDAVILLERGLVAYQAIRGIFIDCSIYIVVVVCGISLV